LAKEKMLGMESTNRLTVAAETDISLRRGKLSDEILASTA